MKFTRLLASAAVASLLIAAPALADTITPSDPQGWSNPAGENGASGSAVITGANPFNGNGSVELSGDRSRFWVGNPYTADLHIVPLSEVTGASFSFAIDPASSRTDYTPALRLHIQDGAQRSELIYEGAYNLSDLTASGGGAWVTTDFSDVFWQYVAGSGTTFYSPGGAQVNLTIADWVGSGRFSTDAYVSAISVGQGSGATSGYHAFADNVTLGTTSGDRNFNFEVGGAVPEPATWAMMLLGFGGLGALLRRSRRRVATAVA